MKKISYLVMDVDGTLTDGKIYMGVNGEICKAFDVKDGYGICNMLYHNNIQPIIITGRKSEIVKMRCEELGIVQVFQDVKNKQVILDTFLKNNSGTYAEVAYIGDDINDLECMNKVKTLGGVVGCPADAVKQIIDVADFVSGKNGGNGAVRDFIEWIVNESM